MKRPAAAANRRWRPFAGDAIFPSTPPGRSKPNERHGRSTHRKVCSDDQVEVPRCRGHGCGVCRDCCCPGIRGERGGPRSMRGRLQAVLSELRTELLEGTAVHAAGGQAPFAWMHRCAGRCWRDPPAEALSGTRRFFGEPSRCTVRKKIGGAESQWAGDMQRTVKRLPSHRPHRRHHLRRRTGPRKLVSMRA